MRKIGSVETADQAVIFKWYLQHVGVEVGNLDDEATDIWVVAEEDCPRAKDLLQEFQGNPDDEKYHSGSLQGRKTYLAHEAAQVLGAARSALEVSVTVVVMALAGLIFLALLFDRSGVLRRYLMFSGGLPYGQPEFPVFSGELWRLVTPVFLHSGILHIVFNLYWVFRLGQGVEERLGARRYLAFLVTVAALSNSVFFYLISPYFGGLSGVVYGYVGFIWGYDRLKPNSLSVEEQGIVSFFVIWYVLGWVLTVTGFFHLANTIHAVGALAGIFWGLLAGAAVKQGTWRQIWNEEIYNVMIIVLLVFGGVVVDSLA